MAIIKTPNDLEKLKYSCKILMSCFHHITPLIKAGVSCGELDKFAYDFITSYDATPSFLNCDDGGSIPYKYSICVSINDEVAHGIAPMDKIIPNNCILTLDIGANYKGLFSDSAMTYIVGEVSEKTRKLVEVARDSMWEGIKILKAGIKLGDIGHQIDTFVQKQVLEMLVIWEVMELVIKCTNHPLSLTKAKLEQAED
jgi:methionyl aminopeptidase